MDARDARPMHLNPLFSESRVVNVSHVQVNADEWTVDFIEEGPELSGCQQKTLFRITIFTTDPNLCFCCQRRQLPHRVQAALIDFIVRNFLGHEPRHHKYGVATEELGCLQLAFYNANRLSADLGVTCRKGSIPVEAGRNV